MITKIVNKFKGFFVRKKLIKQKKCKFSLLAKIDFQNSLFEGRNVITQGVHINHCVLGYATYVGGKTNLYRAKIGRYCSLASNIKIITGQHPSRKFVSIYPAFYSVCHAIGWTYVDNQLYEEHKSTANGYSIEIGNDVWIGDDVSIMEGVTIADGTIVAAGAVVVKDTEPYSVVGGVPAKIIRYRFDKEDIEFLNKLQWWQQEEEWIAGHASYFNDIENLKRKIKGEEKA